MQRVERWEDPDIGLERGELGRDRIGARDDANGAEAGEGDGTSDVLEGLGAGRAPNRTARRRGSTSPAPRAMAAEHRGELRCGSGWVGRERACEEPRGLGLPAPARGMCRAAERVAGSSPACRKRRAWAGGCIQQGRGTRSIAELGERRRPAHVVLRDRPSDLSRGKPEICKKLGGRVSDAVERIRRVRPAAAQRPPARRASRAPGRGLGRATPDRGDSGTRAPARERLRVASAPRSAARGRSLRPPQAGSRPPARRRHGGRSRPSCAKTLYFASRARRAASWVGSLNVARRPPAASIAK